MFSYYLMAFLAIALTAISQLLLKIGANRGKSRHPVKLFLNPFTAIAYALFFIVTLMNLYAYKMLPLKCAVILLPFIYILIGIFSYIFLKEKMNRNQLIGAGIIILGVVLFNIR